MNEAAMKPGQGARAVAPEDPDARYRRARQDWDERFAGHAQAARQWRMTALCAGVLGMIGVGFGVWASVMSERVPYFILVDELGRTEVASEVVTYRDWPVGVVKRDLSDFVRLWRSIPGDTEVLTSNMRRAMTYTVDGDPADTMMKEIGLSKKTSPFVLAQTRTNKVEILSVLKVGGNSWQVEWRETARNHGNGNILGVNRFRGTFVLKRAAKMAPELISVNPLGIIVEHFDIQKLD